jgi:hypothetical protein
MSDLETGVDAPGDDLRAQLTSLMSGETPTAPEQPSPPELDALDAGTEKTAAERARDEAGRFAKKPDEAEAPKAEVPAVAAAKPEIPAANEQAAAEVAPRPPHGWNPEAKAAFEALPPAVKEAVARREQEVNAGFAKLAEYKPLEPLAELAKQNGTTLAQAVGEYRQFEVTLQNDFLGGIGFVCKRFGVDPTALANAILARNGGASHQSAAPGAGQQPNQTGAGPDLSPIMGELASLKQYVQQNQQREAQQQQAAVQQQIEAFKADPKNLYFENVRPQMAKIMQAGLASSLQEAYDAACWQAPEIRNLLINQQGNGQAAAAQQAARATQARQASKSITGSPSVGVATGQAPASSLRGELEQAFASAGSRA